MTDTTEARIARLRATRDRLEAQLADPSTPPYSIAPLSNQLRLTDNQLDKIQRREDEKDDGLPTTPDKATLLDFFRFTVQTHLADGRRGLNAYGRRQEAIYDSWRAAGFVPPPKSYPSGGSHGMPRDEWLAAVDGWVEECRVELARCLDEYERNGATRG